MKKNDFDNELSMDKIDDYNGNESIKKKKTVRNVIIFCLLAGVFFALLRSPSIPEDYVGTKDNPGINTSK